MKNLTYLIFFFLLFGCTTVPVATKAPERNPTSERQIKNKQDLYTALNVIMKSIKSGRASVSCHDSYTCNLQALNAIGVYIVELSIATDKNEVFVWPKFNETRPGSEGFSSHIKEFPFT